MCRHANLRILVGVATLLLVLPAAASETPSPFSYPIPRIHRDRPVEGPFRIQGYVAMISECPPCPAGAVCAPCELPYIVVSARDHTIDSVDRMTSEEVRLQTNQLSGFVRGEHYRFLIRNADVPESAKRRGGFELIAFEPAPAGTPTLTRVDDPKLIAALRTAVQERIGDDFFLDRLPADSTLQSAVTYLTTESSSDLLLGALTGVPTVYGLELAATDDGAPVRVFIFAVRPDFDGEIVYAVSEGGGWPVYLTRAQEPGKTPRP
jgi:hypothetical protein